MHNIYCILLGAGASMDAGVPTSKSLLAKYQGQAPRRFRCTVEEIENELKTSIKYVRPELNIEDVAKEADKRKLTWLYDDIKRFTLKEVSHHTDSSYLATLYSLNLDAHYGYALDGKPMWKRVHINGYPLGPTTTRVFSLNYDMTVEDAIQSHDPYRGLFSWDQEKKKYFFRPEGRFNNTIGIIEDLPDQFSGEHISVAHNGLYKLHGSLSWNYNRLGKLQTLAYGRSIGPKPVVIFGQQEKQRLTYPFNELFYAFSKSISISQALIVIGYAWADRHINDIIYQEISRGMKLIDVSIPDPKKLDHDNKFPDDAIYVKSSALRALLGKDVDVSCGQGKWKSQKGGLVGVVREILHKQLWKTDKEWETYRNGLKRKRK